jgi:hypothetical protein
MVGTRKRRLTGKLFGNQKKNVLLLANAPSGKMRHIATYDYQETDKSSHLQRSWHHGKCTDKMLKAAG